MEKTYYTYAESPIGKLMLAGNNAGLKYIGFQQGKGVKIPVPNWEPSDEAFQEAVHQLTAYFEGTLKSFDLPLAPEGTPFQQAVWKKLLDIPYGATASYHDIAKSIGKPRAVRAVGAANGRNPLPIVIPCHRVIGSNGQLTGYGGGLSVKKALLSLERPNQGLLG